MKLTFVGLGVLSVICLSAVDNNSVHAQVIQDNTFNTSVTPTTSMNGSNAYTITNGTRVDNNLFHSFSQFSIPTGDSAFFGNDLSIENIFSRVTGGNISKIDGSINANGKANLFLLNPAGIIFGKNASLNIGGSFVATTANSIKFEDGTEFSAVNPAAKALLTMSVPVGLQMGSNPGQITVQNTGHQLAFPIHPLVSSPNRSNNPVGLNVNNGNLALIGGKITLDGGVLNAPSGHIELGSASNGIVNLNTASQSWNFDYSNIQQFGDIQLSRQSLADASGTPAGSIQFVGQNISLNDASAALLVNEGNGNSGNINIDASGSLTLRGTGTIGFPQSLLRADNFSDGSGGNIIASASQVFLQDGGSLHGINFAEGTGSNIFVETQDLIQITGISPVSGFASSLNTITRGSGKSGDIQVATNKLQVLDGAVIGNSPWSDGAGGNISINASDFIEVAGENAKNLADSVIVVGTFDEGNSGLLTINTAQLRVRDGGGIVVSTVNQGNAGDLVINASETVEVSGVGSISGLPSRIGVRAELLAPPIRQLFGLPDVITGNIGKLTLNAQRLQVTNQAIVGVDHQGIGDAGQLEINADSIRLDNGGSITAATVQGEGGNVLINSNDLLLRHGSSIMTNADGIGNGGNMTINSAVILALENSDIVANAVQGNGGNINITSQSIFGLKYRNELTTESDITASSQFGLNGTVNIYHFGVDPNTALVELPKNTIDPSKQIASGCNANTGSSFVATGRGGIPQNPTQEIKSDRTWSDIRDISAFHTKQQAQAPETPATLVQATSWRRNAQGKIELFAAKSPTGVQMSLTCASLAKSQP
ncbi:filamentous hemagglutinin N-terminal domain-containing protein [Anabaena sp. CCY 9910]|uniref:two-partner secretion domain-containing protein n=1 Tax=Anabaena sp. CCY 9910 TaxID=3103870 RepID=UPI0039E166A4